MPLSRSSVPAGGRPRSHLVKHPCPETNQKARCSEHCDGRTVRLESSLGCVKLRIGTRGDDCLISWCKLSSRGLRVKKICWRILHHSHAQLRISFIHNNHRAE